MPALTEARLDCWLVTGGAGFIGSHFVRAALREAGRRVVVLDKLTYAGNKLNLAGVLQDPRVTFIEGDIADGSAVEKILADHAPSAVVNFAAESHVDRSIDGPGNFIQTNIVGTFQLLESVRKKCARDAVRFIHVSTDEVYGSVDAPGHFTESSPYAPNSPYSASKAAADHLVRAYAKTYGMFALVTNGSNTYGPFQFPEKLIPLTILNAVDGRRLPIYGDGLYVRDWMHVDDHVEGILAALRSGNRGEKYNLGGGCELTNVALVDRICDALEAVRPAAENPAMQSRRIASYKDLKEHVADRAAHDRRYSVATQKARAELQWSPTRAFEPGIVDTVRWYLGHADWVHAVQAGAAYQRERLGLA